jgi:hypothetical protein
MVINTKSSIDIEIRPFSDEPN